MTRLEAMDFIERQLLQAEANGLVIKNVKITADKREIEPTVGPDGHTYSCYEATGHRVITVTLDKPLAV